MIDPPNPWPDPAPETGEVRFNTRSRDIEVYSNTAWHPVWQIDLGTFPMSIIEQIGAIIEQQTIGNISIRSMFAIAEFFKELNSIYQLQEDEEENSYSSDASEYSHSSSSSVRSSSSSTCNRELARTTSPNIEHNRLMTVCDCDRCTRARALVNTSREDIKKMDVERTKTLEDKYTRNLNGKYDRKISASKSRKLMLP